MDNPCWSSGFEGGDMISPVPAPRHKRKLITTEDSKHRSNKQNTCVNEHIINLMPPPRRKNKFQTYQEINTLLFTTLQDIETNLFKNDIEKDNRVNRLLDYSAATENKTTFSNINLTTCHNNDAFEESALLSDNLCNKEIVSTCIKLASEVDESQKISHFEKDLELGKVLNILDSTTDSNALEKYNTFEEPRASNIFENFLEDRVLDIPLVTAEDLPKTTIDEQLNNSNEDEDCEKNRVNSGFSENSATIVGVFYKPEYSSLGKESKEVLMNQSVSNGLDTMFGLSSKVDDENKTVINVPMDESKKVNIKIIARDSEEDDSGVYFSDSKSPPHRGINLENKVPDLEKENKLTNKENELEFYKTFSCNNGDTFDNKTPEYLGPQNYRKLLDHFEAHTVNAFHQEIFTRLSLDGTKINRNKVIEDWLDSREYLPKKKNNSFSQYLKSMLEPDSSICSLSPSPHSALDEDDRSDNFSDDLKGSKKIEEVVNRNSILQPFTVSNSSTSIHENRSVASSNTIGFVVKMNNVNTTNVNNDCFKATPDCTNALDDDDCINALDEYNSNGDDFKFCEENSVVDLALINSDHNVLPGKAYGFQTFMAKMIELEDDYGYSNIENSEEYSNDNITDSCKLSSLNTNSCVTNRTVVKHGVVNSLVAYFEAINKQEIESSNEDEYEGTAIVHDYHENNEVDKIEKLNVLNSSLRNEDSVAINVSGKFLEDLWNNGDISKNQDITYDHLTIQEFKLKSVTCDNITRDTGEIEALLAEPLNCSIADKTNIYIAGLSFEDFQDTVDTDCENEIENSVEKLVTTDMLNRNDHDVALRENFCEEKNCLNVTESDKMFDEDWITKTTDTPIAYIYDYGVESSFEVQYEEESKHVSNIPDEKFSISSGFLNEFVEKVMDPPQHDDNFEVNETTEMIGATDINLFKPTRIPVVVLSETDVESSTVGSIELHPGGSIFQDKSESGILYGISEAKSIEDVRELSSYHKTSDQCVNFPVNTIDVALEKNWGSIGLKLKGDGKGVFVSDVLPGGSADISELVFKGWIDMKSMQEEMEIFC